ncbi:PLAC8 family protein isoform 1 [Theobroma cacao]|uniref:PLAC8 family protein isoform 1 n=1 Tax=Theobroma cacao TaxID=3641 RepID=A0A061ET13_THECC|nr:PLAC8 family protein isoform 1 [Theobroma cacao]
MAHNNGSNNNDREESSPLLSKQVVEGDEKKEANGKKSKEATAEVAASPAVSTAAGYGWTADGLPLGHGSVVGEPMGRAQWDSPLLACLGRNDEFCSSDVEVCLLGSMAPCVLYGSNVERLGSVPGTFANHCLPYSGLYLIGNSFFGWNCLAPWFSYPSRTAIRRKFNLEAILYLLVNCFLPLHVVSPSCGDGGGGEVKCSVGTCEALNRLCGCCGSCVEDEMQREQCESACDFATHVFCHACALCQEGRELRRRLPHPGFNAQPVLVMMPPGEQTMGRGA